MDVTGRGLGMSNRQMRILCRTLIACAELLAGMKGGWVTRDNYNRWAINAGMIIDKELPDNE
jgi:hypothetical protein